MPLVDVEPGWRNEVQDAIKSQGVSNQGVQFKNDQNPIIWQNLRYRSQPEVRIAQELDKKKVFFFPNCRGRLNQDAKRGNREPDFLICHNGKWGILEVDGESTHPSAAADHTRDREFKSHGVRVIEHFTWLECVDGSQAVVRQFLEILNKS